MIPKNLAQLKPLIFLLGDSNPSVVQKVAGAIKEKLPGIVTDLRQNPELLGKKDWEKIGPIVDDYQRGLLLAEWRAFVHREQDALDLQTGTELISRLNQPALPPDFLVDKIGDLTRELADFLKKRKIDITGPIVKKALTLSEFLGDFKEFRGNTKDYYLWSNHFLEHVIYSGRGIPLSLSSLYILMGKSIQLPLFGVGLPGHLVIGFKVAGSSHYLDPFHGGELITRKQCERIVKRYGEVPTQAIFRPLSDSEFFFRMLTNIVQSFTIARDTSRTAVFQKALWTLRSERFSTKGSNPRVI